MCVGVMLLAPPRRPELIVPSALVLVLLLVLPNVFELVSATTAPVFVGDRKDAGTANCVFHIGELLLEVNPLTVLLLLLLLSPPPLTPAPAAPPVLPTATPRVGDRESEFKITFTPRPPTSTPPELAHAPAVRPAPAPAPALAVLVLVLVLVPSRGPRVSEPLLDCAAAFAK